AAQILTRVVHKDLRAGELHLDDVRRPVTGDGGRRGERKTMVAVADTDVHEILPEIARQHRPKQHPVGIDVDADRRVRLEGIPGPAGDGRAVRGLVPAGVRRRCGHRERTRGGGDRAVVVGRACRRLVLSGRNVAPADAVRSGGGRADERRAQEEIHFGDAAVGIGGRGGERDIGPRREERVVGRGGEADGGDHVEDHVQGGARDGSVVVGGARGQRVRAGDGGVEREAVRSGGLCAQQRPVVEEIDLGDAAVCIGGSGGDRDGGTLREYRVVGRGGDADGGGR